MTKEATIEESLRLAVEAAGGLCFKLPANLYRGIPDRLVLLPGARVFFIELKRSDGKASPHQVRFRQILCTLGFNSLILKGKPDLKEFIETHVES